jgi:Rrf2 family protein
MLFTQGSDYGLRAALELAASWGEPPVTAAELARRGDLPEPFARKVLARLSSAGIARARRGRSGGFTLSRAPDQVSVRDVVEPLQELAPVRCLSNAEIEDPCPVAAVDACATRRAWQAIDERVLGALGSLTLAELLVRMHPPGEGGEHG